MLTISGRTVGGKKPLFADFSIGSPPDVQGDDGVTLRRLIEHVVRKEVDAFRQRQRDRALLRVLSARQIEAAVDRGKVDPGGSEMEPQEIDPDAAVQTAIQAYEDGLYFVVIDGQQATEVDQQVFLRPDSRITFIRLMLLAGG
jgi:hypothetical protein